MICCFKKFPQAKRERYIFAWNFSLKILKKITGNAKEKVCFAIFIIHIDDKNEHTLYFSRVDSLDENFPYS